MTQTFLAPDDMVTLTGRKLKSKQVEALRRMGIPFLINASGRPVVARAAVEGKRSEIAPRSGWQPKVLAG